MNKNSSYQLYYRVFILDLNLEYFVQHGKCKQKHALSFVYIKRIVSLQHNNWHSNCGFMPFWSIINIDTKKWILTKIVIMPPWFGSCYQEFQVFTLQLIDNVHISLLTRSHGCKRGCRGHQKTSLINHQLWGQWSTYWCYSTTE